MLSIHALMAPLVAFTPPSDEAKANWLLLKISFLSFPPCRCLCLTVENTGTSGGTAVLFQGLTDVHSRHKGCSVISVMRGCCSNLRCQVWTAAGRRQTSPIDGQTASSSYHCELVRLSWSH